MLLIENIRELYTFVPLKDNPLGLIKEARILVEEEQILWCGSKEHMPETENYDVLDGEGAIVTPGFIDCHTHLLFHKNRCDDFIRRLQGKNYTQILQEGGGILYTVEQTANASDEELMKDALVHLNNMLACGVTTVEAKSGYGLSLKQELRLLRILKKLAKFHPISIHQTFLGAHAIPKEYQGRIEAYTDLIINEMLPQVAEEGLAKDCDVFIEEGAFSFKEALRILKAAHALGFNLKAHIEQLSYKESAKLVLELPIKSFSHGEYLKEADIKLLATNEVILEILPFCHLFLPNTPKIPINLLRDYNIKLAVATDFNPGSAMCDNLLLAARLCVPLVGLKITQALAGITTNAAKSLALNNCGQIKAGAKADFCFLALNAIEELFYDWTKSPIKKVMKHGHMVYQ